MVLEEAADPLAGGDFHADPPKETHASVLSDHKTPKLQAVAWHVA